MEFTITLIGSNLSKHNQFRDGQKQLVRYDQGIRLRAENTQFLDHERDVPKESRRIVKKYIPMDIIKNMAQRIKDIEYTVANNDAVNKKINQISDVFEQQQKEFDEYKVNYNMLIG